ncbi:unnamed protein product, partial [Phaeothamnion confervicola]
GRADCSEDTSAGLCGRCLSGYSGATMFANTPCVSTAANLTLCADRVRNGNETDVDCGGGSCSQVCATGQNCAAASDCEFGACVGGICGVAVKICSEDCGGRGNCTYIDTAGTALAATACTVDRLLCFALCSCNDGYYGEACQYTAAEYSG